MNLLARRAGHWCNGTPYDNAGIAAKAWRLAAGAALRDAEEISTHPCTHGQVRLLHAADYGYLLDIEDTRHDTRELWISRAHDEMIESCLAWVRALR